MTDMMDNENGMDHDWSGATYFIDPPYTVQKHGYNHGEVDYPRIRSKVENGNGQYIVCGNIDDRWAPFSPLVAMHGTVKSHIECIWHKEPLL